MKFMVAAERKLTLQNEYSSEGDFRQTEVDRYTLSNYPSSVSWHKIFPTGREGTIGSSSGRENWS